MHISTSGWKPTRLLAWIGYFDFPHTQGSTQIHQVNEGEGEAGKVGEMYSDLSAVVSAKSWQRNLDFTTSGLADHKLWYGRMFLNMLVKLSQALNWT